MQLVRGTCEETGFFQGVPESPLGINFIDVVVKPLRKLDEFGNRDFLNPMCDWTPSDTNAGGNASAGYANCSALSPYGIGLRNSPPVCSLTEHERQVILTSSSPSSPSSPHPHHSHHPHLIRI